MSNSFGRFEVNMFWTPLTCLTYCFMSLT